MLLTLLTDYPDGVPALAERIGVSRKHLYDWAGGRKHFQAAIAQRIAAKCRTAGQPRELGTAEAVRRAWYQARMQFCGKIVARAEAEMGQPLGDIEDRRWDTR